MIATIGGSLWYGATIVGVGDLAAGSFVLGGTTTFYSLNLVTQTTAAIGDFPFGAGSGVNVQLSQLGGTNAWGSLTGASGTVTFTSLADGRAVGTFSGTLVPIGPTVGTIAITNGTFDVLVP